MACLKSFEFESLPLALLMTYYQNFSLLCQLPYGFIAKILVNRNTQVLELAKN